MPVTGARRWASSHCGSADDLRGTHLRVVPCRPRVKVTSVRSFAALADPPRDRRSQAGSAVGPLGDRRSQGASVLGPSGDRRSEGCSVRLPSRGRRNGRTKRSSALGRAPRRKGAALARPPEGAATQGCSVRPPSWGYRPPAMKRSPALLGAPSLISAPFPAPPGGVVRPVLPPRSSCPWHSRASSSASCPPWGT